MSGEFVEQTTEDFIRITRQRLREATAGLDALDVLYHAQKSRLEEYENFFAVLYQIVGTLVVEDEPFTRLEPVLDLLAKAQQGEALGVDPIDTLLPFESRAGGGPLRLNLEESECLVKALTCDCELAECEHCNADHPKWDKFKNAMKRYNEMVASGELIVR